MVKTKSVRFVLGTVFVVDAIIVVVVEIAGAGVVVVVVAGWSIVVVVVVVVARSCFLSWSSTASDGVDVGSVALEGGCEAAGSRRAA